MRKSILKASLIAMFCVVACGNDFINVIASDKVSANGISDPGAEKKRTVQRIVAEMQEHIESSNYRNAVELMPQCVKFADECKKPVFQWVCEKFLDNNDEAKVRILDVLHWFAFRDALELDSGFLSIIANDNDDAFKGLAKKPPLKDDDPASKLASLYDPAQKLASLYGPALKLAALAGAINVFEYIVMSSTSWDWKKTEALFDAALVGGNMKIIRICEQNGVTNISNAFYGVVGLYSISACAFLTPGIAEWILHHGYMPADKINEWVIKCAESGNIDLVSCLHKKGADLKAKDMYEMTPIHYASKWWRLEVVKYLVEECHADVEAKDKYGWTPIYIASENGCLDVVKYLHEQCHVDVKSEDKYGDTPISIASENGHLDVVKYLHEECHVEITDKAINEARNSEIKQYLQDQK